MLILKKVCFFFLRAHDIKINYEAGNRLSGLRRDAPPSLMFTISVSGTWMLSLLLAIAPSLGRRFLGHSKAAVTSGPFRRAATPTASRWAWSAIRSTYRHSRRRLRRSWRQHIGRRGRSGPDARHRQRAEFLLYW